MIRKKGILRSTFLFSSLLIVLIVVLSFSILYLAMPGYYRYHKQRTLDRNTQTLVQGLQSAETDEACAALLADFAGANNATALSFDGDGNLIPALSSPFLSMTGEAAFTIVIDEGEELDTGKVIIQAELADSGTTTSGRVERTDMRFMMATETADALDNIMHRVNTERIDELMVVSSLQPIDEAKDVILSLIPWLLALCVAVGLTMTYFFAKRLTRPILQISQAAVRMRHMEPDATARVSTGDELEELARNLDDLYAELRDNIAAIQGEMQKVSALERSKTELMQSASHELKTPIAALNGIVEGMLDNVGVYKDRDRYLGECKLLIDRLSGLVGEILAASRADSIGDDPVLEDIDLAGLVEQVLGEHDVLAKERALQVERSLSPAVVTSDRTLLHRAVSNLVSNAVRYTERGGLVRVAVEPAGGEVLLTIENRCEAIQEDVLGKLTEPFYTRSYSRSREEGGTGLGLYIVRRILEQLHVPFAIENGEIGLRVRLHL